MIILPVILSAAVLMIFFIAPSSKRRRAFDWRGVSFAHRGLHEASVCENTLEAFERACEKKVGIELDVQLSEEGEVVVFHDDTLTRMTGIERRIDQTRLADLKEIALPDGRHIPTFAETLETVKGRVPLLVELKNGKRNEELCEKTLSLLRDYSGRYIIESFNPMIIMWFRKNAPEIIRGQLISGENSYRPQFKRLIAFLLSNLCLNFLSRPDFIAYDGNAGKFIAPHVQRFLFHTPMAVWTVTDYNRYIRALEDGEMPIFENFIPR